MHDDCFNCDGSKLDLHYEHVESIVMADAAEWLDYDGLEFTVVACPYCIEAEPPREIWSPYNW